MKKTDIGLIGLAVMGENLVLNMERHGFSVAVFNRSTEKVDRFLNGRGRGKNLVGCHSLVEFCETVSSPRKIMIMVKAGSAVDDIISQMLPCLQSGDVLIDGGNSFFKDTIRRSKFLAQYGIGFVGAGISGGEEGALNGPSIMPGCDAAVWPVIKNIFQSIAARVDDGHPCCEWIGGDGSGHYVKMVHNGIEYADIQMICEAYFLLKKLLGFSSAELHEIFAQWNQTELDSYLVGITGKIFSAVDPETGRPLVDMILDSAGQKGTGKWTSQSALDLGTAAPTMAEAVFARCLSSVKEERVSASILIGGGIRKPFSGDRIGFAEKIRKALYASKICSYAQGFSLMKQAAREYNWHLNCGEIALMWRGGCIIRAVFLDKIKETFDRDPELNNLLADEFFRSEIAKCESAWREVAAQAILSGIPIPAFASALSYFDGYRSAELPANLLQAQRDYFGAHTYERVDRPRGVFFHTNWIIPE